MGVRFHRNPQATSANLLSQNELAFRSSDSRVAASAIINALDPSSSGHSESLGRLSSAIQACLTGNITGNIAVLKRSEILLISFCEGLAKRSANTMFHAAVRIRFRPSAPCARGSNSAWRSCPALQTWRATPPEVTAWRLPLTKNSQIR